MATSKQTEANRRNAQKSTGPKTPAGKAVAKQNAVKHGLLARNVVLHGQHDGERAREFQQLHQRYWEHYAPVGPVEEMLVERIVTTYWRLHRVVIAEGGEIANSVDHVRWQHPRPNRYIHQLRWAVLVDPTSDVTLGMEDDSIGLLALDGLLGKVRAAVEKDGELTDTALQLTYIGGQRNGLTDWLANLRKVPVENASGLDEAAIKAQQRERLLHEIDRRRAEYISWHEELYQQKENTIKAQRAAAHLPTVATLDKIMCYETKLERQLYRAMDQLERLQRRRQGEDVPPPINMEVSHRV